MNVSKFSVKPKNQIRNLKLLIPALMLTAFVSCGEQEPLVMNESSPSSSANERLAANQPTIRPSTTNSTSPAAPGSRSTDAPNSTSQVAPGSSSPVVPNSTSQGAAGSTPGAPNSTTPAVPGSRSPDAPAPTSPASPASGSAALAAAPTVMKSTPADMARSITSDTTEIVAAFSKPMDASTIDDESFTLSCMGKALEGTVTYSADDNIATLTLPEKLPPNSNCVATISDDVKDSAGAAMSDAFSWSFDTAAMSVPISSNQ